MASKPCTAQASHSRYTLQLLAVFPLHPCCFNAPLGTCSTPQTLHNPLLNCTRALQRQPDCRLAHPVQCGFHWGCACQGYIAIDPIDVQAASTLHHMNTGHSRMLPPLGRRQTLQAHGASIFWPCPWQACRSEHAFGCFGWLLRHLQRLRHLQLLGQHLHHVQTRVHVSCCQQNVLHQRFSLHLAVHHCLFHCQVRRPAACRMLPAAQQRSVPCTQLHAVDVAAMSGCLLQLLAAAACCSCLLV
jgi:hypothetical protein